MAAGRYTSAATSSGRLCWRSRKRASLPMVVVLPEPCRPTSMIPVGPFFANLMLLSTGPISSTSSS